MFKTMKLKFSVEKWGCKKIFVLWKLDHFEND